MIDLDAMKAAGLNSRENSERMLAEHYRNLALKFDLVRKFYEENAKAIMSVAANEWGIDANAWDRVGIKMTPIETSLWYRIRGAEAVLYPQFPVDRFFIDFGNPIAKVAIECDGKAYHQNGVKDDARQYRIESLGWTVYRFTGSYCLSSGIAASIRRIADRHGIAR